MNKLITKIVGAALGLTMAVGVGVGFGVESKKDAVPVHALSESLVFKDQGYSNAEDVSSVDGTNFTVSFLGGSTPARYYDTGTGIRIYGGGSFTVAPNSGYLLTAATMKFSATNYAPGAGQTASVGTLGGLGTTSVTWSGSTDTGFEVSRPASAGHWRFQSVSVTLSAVSSDPSITLSAETIIVNTSDASGKSVTVTPTSFGDGTKYYLWSTNDSNITLVNDNSNTVTVKPNSNISGSATVNVKVWGGNVTESNALTDSVAVVIETPKTVAEALQLSGINNVYTKGIISRISEVSTYYGNATYFISDDATTTNELQVYRGKYIGNTSFTSEGQIQVGDTVVVFGNITTYNTVVQYDQGNYLISLKSEARLSLSPNTVEVTVGTDVEVTASPSNFESGTITYAFDEDDCATLSHVGNTITVHGDAVGSYTFTVTGQVGGVAQASAELVVTVVNPYPTNISRSGYASFTDTQTFAQGTGSLTITYSDSSTATKHLGDIGVKLLISGVEVAASASTASYLGSNSAKISYTEEGHTISTSTYTLNVNAELEVTSFEGVPEYLIIDSSDPLHSATITVNYKSLNGEPELSITSSNPAKLPVTFNEEDNIFEGTTGMAEFTVTAGNTVGQYSVTASVTYGTRIETKSFSIDVRGEAPAPSEGNYEKVTSLSDLATGNYVIALDNGSVYGMTRSLASGKYAFSDALTVTDDKISATEGDSIQYYLSISGTGDSRTATIKNLGTNNYVYYSNSTNLGEQVSSYDWTITTATHGSFRLASKTSGRGLHARTGTFNQFGGYSSGNVDGKEYYDIELFKYVEGGAKSSFDLISEFVSNYMHMSDVSIGNHNDTGACKGDSGYYLTAKRAWNDMVDAYEGEDDLETVFRTSFEDAYARYMAWADAMNDAAPFDGYDEVHTAKASAIFDFVDNESGLMPAIIVIVSLVSITAIGGYFFIRKRKEQ